MNKKYLIIGGIVLAVLILGGVLLMIFGNKKTTPTTNNGNGGQSGGEINIDTSKEINLTIWGVFDDSSIFQPLIRDFNKKYPNIKSLTLSSQTSFSTTLISSS